VCDSPESKMKLGVLRGLGRVSPSDTMQCRGIKDVLKNAVLSSVVYVYTYVPRFVVQNVTYTLPTRTMWMCPEVPCTVRVVHVKLLLFLKDEEEGDETFFESSLRKFGGDKVFELIEEYLPLDAEWAGHSWWQLRVRIVQRL
jgi:hypothetical protein